MKVSIRHIILLIGIILIIVSFLFFGHAHDKYEATLLIGLLLVGISFVVVLIRDNKKNKIRWTAIAIVAILIQQLTEQVFIKISYTILINKHQSKFDEVTKLLLAKSADVSTVSFPVPDTSNTFTRDEINLLNTFWKDSGVKLIYKDRGRISYITYGRIDIYGGLVYLPPDDETKNRRTHLRDNWYF